MAVFGVPGVLSAVGAGGGGGAGAGDSVMLSICCFDLIVRGCAYFMDAIFWRRSPHRGCRPARHISLRSKMETTIVHFDDSQ